MSEKQVFGALICCTSGGVFKPSSIKLLIDCLAKMGYNQLEICMEDIYGIDGEPYFGYLRGGYSKQEMREVALYGQERGVEIVPAIQTLAHFPHLAKLPAYSDIFDVDDVLMIGDPRVYALIDRMFQTMREFFLTDQINIGFDEAYLVGLGKYLREHGYRDRFDLLMEHLMKVVAIAKEHGFKPHMWSDMFFRLVNRGEYYGKGISIPESVAAKIPEGLSLVYWDYFNEDESLFDSMVTSHEAMGAPIWYAGSAIVHDGFAPLNRKSLRVLEMAFRCLRRHSVHNFLITMWGDDGNECSFFAALPSLYAARRFAQGEFNLKVISEEFGKLFGFSFEDMLVLDSPNETASNPNFKKLQNPCKSLLYNDPFLGWKDYDLAKEGPIDFAGKAKALREAGSSVPAFSYLFETLASLCEALEVKAWLGLKARAAYKAEDKKALKALLPSFDEAHDRIIAFHKIFRKQWLHDNEPFGWEVHEARLGGLEARLLDCKERIAAYLAGEVDSIPELEKEILPYADWGLQYNLYIGLVTVGKM